MVGIWQPGPKILLTSLGAENKSHLGLDNHAQYYSIEVMNAIDRAAVLKNLRKIATGDSAYILRAYMARHCEDIAAALNLPVSGVCAGVRGTADSELNAQVVDLIDEVL